MFSARGRLASTSGVLLLLGGLDMMLVRSHADVNATFAFQTDDIPRGPKLHKQWDFRSQIHESEGLKALGS